MLTSVFGVSVGYVEKILRQRQAIGRAERVRYRPGPKSRLCASPTPHQRFRRASPQAVNSNKRAAQSKVVRRMVPNVGTISAPVGAIESGDIVVNAR